LGGGVYNFKPKKILDLTEAFITKQHDYPNVKGNGMIIEL
jgi:hypothetical protein